MLVAAASLHAQTTATTDPVGFTTIPLPPGTDVRLPPPLTAAPSFQGAGTSSNFVVTVNPSPGWSNNQFADTNTAPYYLQVLAGSQNGMIFDILSNNSNSVTLADNGISPTGITNQPFRIAAYNTLGSIFPASDTNVSFEPSPNAFTLRTQVLFPNNTNATPSINRAFNTTYFFSSGAWRRVGAPATNSYNNQPILPETYVIVRNPTNALTNLAVTVAGSVATGSTAIALEGFASGANDNYVSASRPADQILDDLGLITSGVFEASPTAFQIRDQLLVFNNNAPGINKSASATYYFLGGTNNQWRRVGSTTNNGLDVIPAASGLVIRKATNSGTGTQFWTNTLTIAP